MNAHRFDPLSALFAMVAVAAGIVVIAGAGDVVDSTASGTWIAVAALAIGMLLLPWGRRHRPVEARPLTDLAEPDLVDPDLVDPDLSHPDVARSGSR